jgi:hypothetical protein
MMMLNNFLMMMIVDLGCQGVASWYHISSWLMYIEYKNNFSQNYLGNKMNDKYHRVSRFC